MNDANSAERLADNMDREELRYQAFCADRLIRLLHPAPGDKLLDACAGTGTLSLAMAQAVGPAGRVTAIDSDEAMLERLDAKVRQFGIGNIDVHNMGPARLDFRRDYFHAVACSLAWQLPPDMAAIAREWYRVLQPGGGVLWAVLAHGAFEPYASELCAALVARGSEPAELSGLAFSGPEAGGEVLSAAGFSNIGVDVVALGYHLRDASAWWQVVSYGPLRDWLRPLSGPQRDALRNRHLTDVERHVTADGLWLEVPVLIWRGTKPAI